LFPDAGTNKKYVFSGNSWACEAENRWAKCSFKRTKTYLKMFFLPIADKYSAVFSEYSIGHYSAKYLVGHYSAKYSLGHYSAKYSVGYYSVAEYSVGHYSAKYSADWIVGRSLALNCLVHAYSLLRI
jgi:hypothetical protein